MNAFPIVMNASPKITAVLNCHREGELVSRSLASVVAALRAFDGSGASWEIVCVADRSDSRTLAVLSSALGGYSCECRPIRLLPADLGDLGLSRNFGVENARGQFVGFVDGDDLVSENWFKTAYSYAQEDRLAIFHPECSLYFGDTKAFMLHREQTCYDLWSIFFHNLWTALSFASVETYRRTPYTRNSIQQGFGYEDWHWNCETASLGHKHRVAFGTCHFIRIKSVSLGTQSARNRCIIRPTALWATLDERAGLGAVSTGRVRLPAPIQKWALRLGGGQETSLGSQGTLGERLFRDPVDVDLGMMPPWVHTAVAAAKTHEPGMDFSGVLVNFSPVLPNPFTPCFHNRLKRAVIRGIDRLYFADSPATLARLDLSPADLALAEGPGPGGLGELLPLGSKFEMFLAMITVQSRCRELHILNSHAGFNILQAYALPLAANVDRIYYATSALPPEFTDTLHATGAVCVNSQFAG